MNGIVAVVGRPNVGKSTLFNRIVGKRMSIVDDTPGVTRDRIYAKAEWLGKEFMLVDTGGIEPDSKDVILSQMRMQAQLAIDKADVIIFVTDVTSGVTANDADVAAMLQKSGKPVVLCVNKCDGIGEVPPEFYEFYNLGLGDPIAVTVREICLTLCLKICLRKILSVSIQRMLSRLRSSASRMRANLHL